LHKPEVLSCRGVVSNIVGWRTAYQVSRTLEIGQNESDFCQQISGDDFYADLKISDAYLSKAYKNDRDC